MNILDLGWETIRMGKADKHGQMVHFTKETGQKDCHKVKVGSAK